MPLEVPLEVPLDPPLEPPLDPPLEPPLEATLESADALEGEMRDEFPLAFELVVELVVELDGREAEALEILLGTDSICAPVLAPLEALLAPVTGASPRPGSDRSSNKSSALLIESIIQLSDYITESRIYVTTIEKRVKKASDSKS
ncbi:MAG: hypothetical protein JST12_16555 [Armatimonadetes bacterium]|nr:hypothetical protein [Armatimonadota bacterium]